MSKHHLTDRNIENIVNIIDGWSGKLSWALLVVAIEARVGSYTRQTLNSHTRIKLAFSQKKIFLRGRIEKRLEGKPVELQKALERIEKLDSKNARLTAENSQLLEQFVRWSYNASNKGMTEDQLNAALPEIDRERTKE